MSKHYCTNCGAKLEKQVGFDPHLGAWTCTDCGQVLYGDIIESTMTRFDGIVWYCDSCGAILSNQFGFSDIYDTWICSECGYQNTISERNILGSDDEENTNYMDLNEFGASEVQPKYSCPKCGTDISKQFLFYDDFEWTCNECGGELVKKDNEYVLKEKKTEFECPKCHATLNAGYCFSPDDKECKCWACERELYRDGDEYRVLYKCPECGENISKQFLFQENDEWDCSCCGSKLVRDDRKYVLKEDSEPVSFSVESDLDGALNNITVKKSKEHASLKKLEFKYSKRQAFMKRLKACFFNGGTVKIDCDDDELIGMNFKEVTAHLKQLGFCNVVEVPSFDLHKDSCEKEFDVASVKIDGSSSFRKGDRFEFRLPIKVLYHRKRRIAIHYSNKSVRNKSVGEVYPILIGLGFTNIMPKMLPDLKIGLVVKEYAIESMTVLGLKKYTENQVFEYDVPIEIVFHTFKKKS